MLCVCGVESSAMAKNHRYVSGSRHIGLFVFLKVGLPAVPDHFAAASSNHFCKSVKFKDLKFDMCVRGL